MACWKPSTVRSFSVAASLGIVVFVDQREDVSSCVKPFHGKWFEAALAARYSHRLTSDVGSARAAEASARGGVASSAIKPVAARERPPPGGATISPSAYSSVLSSSVGRGVRVPGVRSVASVSMRLERRRDKAPLLAV